MLRRGYLSTGGTSLDEKQVLPGEVGTAQGLKDIILDLGT